MQIFNSGFFWFVEGILFVVMIMGVREWARGKKVPMTAWKWALFLAWVLFAGFTIAFVGTSFGEGEATAAIRGGLLFGLIAVIGGVGVWRVLRTGATAVEGDVVQQS